MNALAGLHPVREALRAGQALERVLVVKGLGGPRVQEIVTLCRERRVPLRFETREQLDRLSEGHSHQGVLALQAERSYSSLEDVLGSGAAVPELLVVLDGVEDPHNLGAIIRSANGVGASAVLLPERRAVGLTETVARTSAGALAHTPVVRIGNLSQTLERLKEAGYWIYGLDERGEERFDAVTFQRPTVLVLGGEGQGLHQLTKKHCDVLIRIPMAGAIASLNVSVAAGVALYAWRSVADRSQQNGIARGR